MFRKFIISSILLLALFACNKNDNTITVKGTIKGANNAPLVLAHIHAAPLGQSPYETKLSFPVEDGGSFAISLADSNYWSILVTAVDHQSFKLPIIFDSNLSEIDVQITLQANDYKDSFDEVRIIGDWNNYNFNQAEAMRPQYDGTFVYNRPVKTDTLGYQLVNVLKQDRSINGTMADFYKYDGGGDYISQIKTKNRRAKVVFNPNEIIRQNDSSLPLAKFDTQSGYLNEFLEISERASNERSRARKEMEQFSTYPDYKFDVSEFENYLHKQMDKNDRLLAQYAALHYAELMYLGIRADTAFFKKIVKMIPVDDPMWSAKPFMISDAFKIALGDSNAHEIFSKNLHKIPGKMVRASLLIDLGFKAKEINNLDELKRIYADLQSNYGDLREISFFVNQLNPNQKIFKGKPVPGFTVYLMDEKKNITNKDLLGKFYIIDFWATWCAPCVAEMPNMHDAYKKYRKKNFEILSLSLDPRIASVKKFRKEKWPMPWFNTFLQGYDKTLMTETFEVQGIPRPILIDPEGVIIATESDLRGNNLEKTLAKFLE